MSDDNKLGVSVGSKEEGWPCPKDGTTLTKLERMPGWSWCSLCKTIWQEIDEVSLDDLDGAPETDA